MYDTMKKENMKKEVSAIKIDIVIEKMVKYAWLTWHLKKLRTWCLLPPYCSRYIKMNFWNRFYEPLGFWKKLKACFGISSVHKRQWQKWSSKGIFTKLDVLVVCALTTRQLMLQTTRSFLRPVLWSIKIDVEIDFKYYFVFEIWSFKADFPGLTHYLYNV